MGQPPTPPHGAILVLGSSALREERLLLMQTGSSSPCLDLRYAASPPARGGQSQPGREGPGGAGTPGGRHRHLVPAFRHLSWGD